MLGDAAEIVRLKAELAAARERIAELEARADVDPLTGILNRRGFERELARTLSYLKRYGGQAVLIYLDLDGFKAVNDAHGHAAGDALLRAVAARLTAQVRASDVVGRLGGDEFAVTMWNLGADAAEAKARELEALIAAECVSHDGAQLSAGVSAGIAVLDGSLSAAAAIDAADKSMYARKKARRK
jgi:diguanylate cyclase (GGDEF)-like protein